MISGQPNQSVDYTIECHGVKARSTAAEYESTYISSHWIEFCLKVSLQTRMNQVPTI